MRRRPSRAGFSLLELMIALAVIAVALMGVLSMIINAARNKEMIRELATAKEAATVKIEEVKTQPFATVVAKYASPNNVFTVDGLSNPTNVAGGKKGRGEVKIISSNPELLDITVVVTWTGVSGRSHDYSARSLYAR